MTARSQQPGSLIVQSNSDLVDALPSCLNEPDGAFVELEPGIEIVVHHHAITHSQGVPVDGSIIAPPPRDAGRFDDRRTRLLGRIVEGALT